MPAQRLAVVGGGWAGLAAALEATRGGFDVTLFEMAPDWGGRARRVEIDGLALDNGQHILIGAYRETLRLMQSVGVDIACAFLRTPLQLTTPHGHGLSLPPGAPMLAFVRGVWAQKAWSLADRLRVLMTAGQWAAGGFRCDAGTTVAQLASALPSDVRAELIDPLCVAALNTPAHSASGTVFLRVLRDALFSGRGSADLMLPKRRLSELFPLPAVAWLSNVGATLRLRTRVECIAAVDAQWQVNDALFDRVILATTATESARLVRPFAATWADIADALPYEPIVTIYARSDGTRLSHAMLALPSDEQSRPAQFVFDHGQLGGEPGMLAFVVSGAAPWLERGLDVTQQSTLDQARQLLADQLHGPLSIVRTFTEKRATFRCTPALQRPPAAIAPGLWAAGDYVDGPYPATLEGAVRSALEAVQALTAVR